MDPIYRCTQPYPYQRGQVHYRPYYYPSTEPASTPMYADPAPFPMHYECCPWGGSYGYSYPVHGHGCCNGSHFQGNYAWRPYSHVPPVHCHGNHPSFQAPHTIPYIPVPDYSIGNPRYEYENNMPRDHHCCGCPNLQCSKKEEKNVRIEEEDPDKEMKSNESLVPLQLKNYRHPIVWFPSEYGNNEEHEKKESEYTDQKEDLHDNRKIIEQKPAVLPNDVNNSGSLKKSGDQVRNQNRQDDGKGNFPFPILWMPYKPEEMEKREGEVSPEPSMESYKLPYSGGNSKMNGEHTNHNASSRKKDIPVKQVEQLHEKENTGNHKAKENNASVKVSHAPSRTKDIPVEQVEQLHEKENSGNHKAKENNASVKDFIDNGDEKCSEGSAQRKSTSPKKASLPPVCLRVDPLPRRKNTNGSSRSHSPPGDKGKLNQSSNEASIIPSSTEIVKSNGINDDESKNGSTNKKPIEVMEGKTGQGGDVDVNTTHTFEKDIQAKQTDERSTEEKRSRECTRADKADVRGQLNDTESQIAEKEELSMGKEVIANEVKELERKKLPDLEAAIVIQSAYRGFAIRRWEPLKKLKQIAEVREKIAVIKLLIQEMELSSDIQRDNKQIHMIGETIMSLLLRLDTVQGLHPSIRDIRKSVARELVCLQEKLDSLIDKKPSHGHESTNGVDEGAFKETKNDASIQDGHRVENTGVDSILSKDTQEAEAHLVQSCHGQSVNMEISEPMLVGELVGGEKKSTEISESCGIERIEAGPKADVKRGDEQDNEVQENKEESISFPLTESGQDMTDSPTVDGDMSRSELAELFPGVLDGDIDAQGCKKHRQIKSGEHEAAVNELMADVERAKEIEEGSKAESVTTELKDNNRRDGNKEYIELCEEPLPKSNDIQVQAEENLSINNEFVEIHDKTDEKIGSEEAMVDKLRDTGGAGAESDENTSQPSQNTGAKMKEPKAADNETGSEAVVEDKLGDAIPELDERTSQPSCTTGPKISEPKGGDDKNGSEDLMDDELGDAVADLREEIVEEKLGDSLTESDECPSQPPYYTGSKIKESDGAGDKIGSEEIADNKLEDAIAESYECTSRLPKDAGEKINEPTETPDELELQMGEEPCQGENEIDNTVPEAIGGNDPKNSSTYEEVLDMPTERKAALAKEYDMKQFQLEEHIEVHDSESSDGNEKNAAPEGDVPHGMAFIPAGVTEPAPPTTNQGAPEGDVPHGMAFIPAGVTELASPTTNQGSHNGSDTTESNRKLMEENEKLREMMEKLIKAGQEQLTTISSLSGRVKDLEKQLSKRKKLKMHRYKVPSSGLLCKKPSHNHLKDRTMRIAI